MVTAATKQSLLTHQLRRDPNDCKVSTFQTSEQGDCFAEHCSVNQVMYRPTLSEARNDWLSIVLRYFAVNAAQLHCLLKHRVYFGGGGWNNIRRSVFAKVNSVHRFGHDVANL
jgi:hypothetical protein